jgi:hypothetical protein
MAVLSSAGVPAGILRAIFRLGPSSRPDPPAKPKPFFAPHALHEKAGQKARALREFALDAIQNETSRCGNTCPIGNPLSFWYIAENLCNQRDKLLVRTT